MAIFHLSAKVISRAAGRSSVAAAAYRSAEKLRDHRQGLEHDYTRKGGVVHVEIMAPENAPGWMRDRDQLWNAIEIVEKRRDAQLAREIEVAFPRELDPAQRLDLLRDFVQQQFVDRGMIADVSIHEAKARDGNGQPHAHIMLTMRELTGSGFGKKDRSWNDPDLLLGWREKWADHVNTALERAGRSERVDHRSLDAQRAQAEYQAEQARAQHQDELAIEHEKRVIELCREPEPKIGPTANAMEERGSVTERGSLRREAHHRNEQRKRLGLRQLELRLELIERGRAFVAAARQRLSEMWGRAEAAVSQIKDRVIGRAEKPQALAEAEKGNRRRAAVLGHYVEKDRNPSSEPNQDSRDAILGRHRNGHQGREIGLEHSRGR